ncbi:uncharacterized protein K489DRAFT_120753 [Dissoconium aciculare CBS 342.82]|uniref:Uncharacterized protein n=1 Tax=Dissoconium aciculare CBS 342.82 TaxID=1314786 RepID=A0A6J3MF57_9PEZI|nr:uncharacterized protein K489DRAFT_120753 [Dissoconium aciculare CBS 342.82]KAF1826605.1 hypothetical protein K489DRAFT_120753 [Dissoconium aciculare CBS 342.82]
MMERKNHLCQFLLPEPFPLSSLERHAVDFLIDPFLRSMLSRVMIPRRPHGNITLSSLLCSLDRHGTAKTNETRTPIFTFSSLRLLFLSFPLQKTIPSCLPPPQFLNICSSQPISCECSPPKAGIAGNSGTSLSLTRFDSRGFSDPAAGSSATASSMPPSSWALANPLRRPPNHVLERLLRSERGCDCDCDGCCCCCGCDEAGAAEEDAMLKPGDCGLLLVVARVSCEARGRFSEPREEEKDFRRLRRLNSLRGLSSTGLCLALSARVRELISAAEE